MHAAGAARFGIERAFKDGSEYRRADAAPVEAAGRLLKQQLLNLRREVWDLNRAVEQTSVDVGEFFKRVVKVRVALINGRVQRIEQVKQIAADITRSI